MAFRVGSAILGHMGMELDLRQENESDLEVLRQGIAVHKQHRDLIHSGRFLRLESAANSNLIGVIGEGASEALFAYTVTEPHRDTLPAPIRFDGLDAGQSYRVRMVWPPHNPSISAPSIMEAANLMQEGYIFSGAALIEHGIQPPLTFPDTCLIFHCKMDQ